MKEAVIFDLDGTLFNVSHRAHYVQGVHKNWKKFFEEIPNDVPYPDIVRLNNDLSQNNFILHVTGRPEECRQVSQTQMNDAGVVSDGLFMRATGDYRPDHVVKSQILDGIIADGYNVKLVVDDRQSVVDMWRERGLTCLQARAYDDYKYPHTGILTIMVGPSGAGKSTYVKKYDQQYVVSTDQLRFDLTGDFRNQEKNDQVYAALHDIVRTRLRHGIPVVVDSTNCRRRDRVALVSLAAPHQEVEYIVLNRPVKEKKLTAGWRENVFVKGVHIIDYYENIFQQNLKEILKGDGFSNVKVHNRIKK